MVGILRQNYRGGLAKLIELGFWACPLVGQGACAVAAGKSAPLHFVECILFQCLRQCLALMTARATPRLAEEHLPAHLAARFSSQCSRRSGLPPGFL